MRASSRGGAAAHAFAGVPRVGFLEQSTAHQERQRASFDRALAECPAPGSGAGCNEALPGLARLAKNAGLDQETCLKELADGIPRGSRDISREIRRAVGLVYRDDDVVGGTFLRPVTQRYEPLPADTIRRTAVPCTPDELVASSPVPIPDSPAAQLGAYLVCLYDPGDALYRGPKYKKDFPEAQRRYVLPVSEHVGMVESGGGLPPDEGYQATLNPLTGAWGKNQSGEPSTRCLETVREARYWLLESDTLSLPEQLANINGLIRTGWPVVSVVFSGSKSLHCLMRTPDNSTDVGLWRRFADRTAATLLGPCGYDANVKDASRLCRSPGGVNEKSNGLQRLLWLAQPPSDRVEAWRRAR